MAVGAWRCDDTTTLWGWRLWSMASCSKHETDCCSHAASRHKQDAWKLLWAIVCRKCYTVATFKLWLDTFKTFLVRHTHTHKEPCHIVHYSKRQRERGSNHLCDTCCRIKTQSLNSRTTTSSNVDLSDHGWGWTWTSSEDVNWKIH